MRRSPHHPLALAVLALMAGAAPAEPATRIDVVGTGPLPGLDLSLDQIAGQVQGGRSADLERSQALDLSAYLQRRLGGVHVNEVQGNPLQVDLNYRGFTASPLLGTAQGLSVYLDGVRLNQPFGDVVSWDLIPRQAIASFTLMPGSNPLFGLNTLGGALSLQTKDGLRAPGQELRLSAGSNGRVVAGFEHGGGTEALHAYVTGQWFDEDGWRVNSASRVSQLFAKVGTRTAGGGRYALSLAAAESRLNGNGLQEQRLLAADWASVYTQPDTTRNRAQLLSFNLEQPLGDERLLSGNAYVRRVRTATLNGDINEDSLDQAVYQPNADERAALAAAGYSGFPASGESAANTPFPKWRCIANALLRDEPAEKCNGLINTTHTTQHQAGFTLQLAGRQRSGTLTQRWAVGAALDRSRVHFTQGSELGYLNPDRTVTGVGAFGDGVTGGDVDGEPYDTRVDLSARTQTVSLFASDTLSLGPDLHLTLAGRWNRSTVRNRDAIQPGGGTGSLDGDHVFSRLNPALGLTWRAAPGLTGYAGVSQGSRAPSAVELGCADPESPCKLPNAMAGDPPLRQVVTTTVEAGLRGGTGLAGGTLSWNLGLFRADNRDDILFVADDASGFGYFRNFGRTRRQGLEAGFEVQAGAWRAGAHYTWLDATFRSPERVNGAGNSHNDEAEEGLPGVEGTIEVRPGDRLPLVPRHLLKLHVQWTPLPGLSLNADVQAVGGSYARGNENNRHQPDGTYYLGAGRSSGYAVANLGAQWQARPGLTLFAQVDNLFDRRYATAAQLGATGFDAQGRFVARPFPANAEGERPRVGSTFYAPGAPRAWSAGVRWRF